MLGWSGIEFGMVLSLIYFSLPEQIKGLKFFEKKNGVGWKWFFKTNKRNEQPTRRFCSPLNTWLEIGILWENNKRGGYYLKRDKQTKNQNLWIPLFWQGRCENMNVLTFDAKGTKWKVTSLCRSLPLIYFRIRIYFVK